MTKTLLWFRPSPFRKILSISIRCGFSMMLGVLIVGAGLDSSGRVPTQLHSFFLIFGMICVVFSAFFAFWSYYKTLLKDDSILLLNSRQIQWSTPLEQQSIDWICLIGVEQHDQNICLYGKDSTIHLPKGFVGITDTSLVQTILDTQKKVLLGVLS